MGSNEKRHEYHFSFGDSSKGPIGYCATVEATSKAEAVKILKKVIPTEWELGRCGESSSDNEAVIYIQTYLNPDAITESDIEEVVDLDEEVEEKKEGS